MTLPIVYHPDHVVALPESHRFPMAKFGKVYEWLVRDGVASLDQFHLSQPATPEQATLCHDPRYVAAYLDGTLDNQALRRIGFPWSEQLVHRTLAALGSTVNGYVFHIGLALVFLGYAPHIEFIRRVIGIGWPAELPRWVRVMSSRRAALRASS